MTDFTEATSTKIPVVFCFDVNYAPYATVATYSLIKNTCTPLKIYWIVPSHDLQAVATFSQQIKKYPVELICVGVNTEGFQDFKVTAHINSASYIRLMIPKLIAEEKVIYLDSDTLVIDDLLLLYQTNLGEHVIAGVIDPGGADTSRIPRNSNDQYVNSGVLLMNLDRLRKDDFMIACMQLHARYQDEVVWADQCLINKFAENNKLILDPKWNRQVFSHALDQRAWTTATTAGKTKVLHFLGHIKPWQKSCVLPIADFWWAYADELSLPGLHRIHLTWREKTMRLAYRATPGFVKAMIRRLRR